MKGAPRHLAWLTAIALVTACAAPPPPVPANVVLITIDTLRRDHLSAYGYFRPTSPVIDELARQGLCFERAIAPMATTLPSHVSLMTAAYTVRHGVQSNLKPGGDPSLVFFAEALSRQGYETAAFVAATPLKRHSGIGRGFSHFDEPEGDQRRAGEVTDRVLQWLRGRPPRPFFLWVHYFDPHAPYKPPPPFDSAFSAGAKVRGFLEQRAALHEPPYEAPDMGLERLLGMVDRYDGEILYTDTEIGRLFDELRAEELWDRTAVVLAADHGEGLGQHGVIQHGRIYQEQLRVPLILKPPADSGLSAQRLTTPASLVDVVPTLAALLGLPEEAVPSTQVQGIDLLAPRNTRRWVFSERVHRQGKEWSGRKYALTGKHWKYFHMTEQPDELYDLSVDPFELQNVLEDHPRVAREMHTALLEVLSTSSSETMSGNLPVEIRDELRGLGYVP